MKWCGLISRCRHVNGLYIPTPKMGWLKIFIQQWDLKNYDRNAFSLSLQDFTNFKTFCYSQKRQQWKITNTSICSEIFREITDNPATVLTTSTTADDVEEWDLFVHVQLLVGIEEKFELVFPRPD
jgi:hypothetical protein